MTLSQKRKYLNKVLPNTGTTLQQWLDNANAREIPGLSTAIEGIFCGREGSIKEELSGDYAGLYLTMGWYTVYEDPKVEYAYIS